MIWLKSLVLLCVSMVTISKNPEPEVFDIDYSYNRDGTLRATDMLGVHLVGDMKKSDIRANLTLSSSDESSLLLCNENFLHCQQQLKISVSVNMTFVGLKAVKKDGDSEIKDRNVTVIPQELKNSSEFILIPKDFNVTVKDNRRLQVGFASDSDVVEFEGDSVTLQVKAYSSENARLKDPLHLIITLLSKPGNVVKNYTLVICDAMNKTIISGLHKDRHYLATISIPDPQAQYVQLHRDTVRVEYSVRSMLWDIMTQLTDLKEQINQTKNEMVTMDDISQAVQNIEPELLDAIKSTEPPTQKTTSTASSSKVTKATTTLNASPTATTTTAVSSTSPTTTTVVSSTSPTATTAESSTSVTATTAKATTLNNTSVGSEPTDGSTTKVAKSSNTSTKPTKNTTSTVEEEESTKSDQESKDNFMWWIFVGFLGLISLLVAGYLLYNHRAKVKVYVGNMWTSGSKPSTPSTRRSNKYSPLPTSIHDTLTHED